MTPEEFMAKMQEISKIADGDVEHAHGLADDLLCEALTKAGYGDGVKVFEDMDKWYA